MLEYFAMSRLDEPTDYIFYHTMYGACLTKEEREKLASIWETDLLGHACEMETSLFMACCPGKTKLEYAPKQSIEPLNRFKHLRDNGINNALWWYADYLKM